MLKNKSVLFAVLIVALMIIFALNAKTYALTLPWLDISSNNYSNGDKVISNSNIVEVEKGKTLKLYAIIVYGNEMMVPGNPDSVGVFVQKTNLSNVTWTSDNTDVASVDNNGIVTGISEGTAVITAQYDGESATYNINVIKSNEVPSPDVTTINTIDIIVPTIKEGDKKLEEKDVKVIANGNINVTPAVMWYKYDSEIKDYEAEFEDGQVEGNSKYRISIVIFTNDFIYTEGTDSNSNDLNEVVISEDVVIKVNNKIIDKTNEDFFEDFGNMIAIKYYIDTEKNTEVLYNVVEGKDATYIIGKDKTLTIRIDAPFNKFLKVFIDNKEVDSKNYEVKEGSTVITFKEAYLKTLSKGKYDLKVAFEGGDAFSKLTILDKNGNNVNTDDGVKETKKEENKKQDPTKVSGTIPYAGGEIIIILGAVAIIGLGIYIYRKNKDLRGV